MTIRPRELQYMGHVRASGLMIARTRLPEAVCRARVLDCWHTGCRLYEYLGAWFLVFARPRWLDSRRAVGAPLVANDGLLATWPPTAAERRELAECSVAFVANGAVVAFDLSTAREVDPADWLDVSELCWIPVEPVASPPVAIIDQHAPPDPQVEDTLISRLGKAPGGRDQLRQALAAAPTGRHAGDDIDVAPVSAPARPSRIGGWFRRLLGRSPWTQVIGKQHARYMRAMAKMFEHGDLDQALLHAIPAAEVSAAAERNPALSWLAPRSELRIGARRVAASSNLNLEQDSYRYLLSLYRRAFEQLERDGRIDEAAYVLLELLGETEEGVLFLDKHDRSELAAEVAEARDLEPGLVVRLWFRAKQPARAVRYARRTGAFADAVVRLERTDAEAAARLRLLWADYAASAGDYAVAVEAAWPVREARPLAREWIDRGIASGGPMGARMLVKKLEVSPEAAGDVMRRATEIMADDRRDHAHVRLALGQAVLDGPRSDSHDALGSLVTRGLIRDAGRGPNQELRTVLSRLKDTRADGPLRVDLPAIPAIASSPLSMRTDVVIARVDAHDVGAVRVYDAAFLPNGRLLVALGELGLQLRSRRGRVITHFDCPAHRLVVSHNGLRALAVAQRQTLLVTRIQVDERKADTWTELALDGFAPAFDGALWFVAKDNAVMALDTTGAAPECLWRVAEPGCKVGDLAVDPTIMTISWLQGSRLAELWTYTLPELRMVQRPALDESAGHAVRATLAPAGQMCATMLAGETADQPATRVYNAGARGMQLRADLGRTSAPLTMSNNWLVLETRLDDRVVLSLYDLAEVTARASIALAGTTSVGARLAPGSVTVCDDRGRVVVASSRTGERIRDLRIAL